MATLYTTAVSVLRHCLSLSPPSCLARGFHGLMAWMLSKESSHPRASGGPRTAWIPDSAGMTVAWWR